jgi:transcriptional regulator with XRE-family HTH domain
LLEVPNLIGENKMPRKKNLEYDEAIGSIMKEMMDDRGWSYKKLADKLSLQYRENFPEVDYNRKDFKHTISETMVRDYLSGGTLIAVPKLISFCQLFEITLDAFMTKVYRKLNINYMPTTSNEDTKYTLEKAYMIFAKKVFGEKIHSYAFDTFAQKQLFSTLLFGDKEQPMTLHFVHPLVSPELINPDTNEKVPFHRGRLIFEMKNGMCHVTAISEVNSQAATIDYGGFAIITNPRSNEPICNCFLWEINYGYGRFIILSFRLSELGRHSKRKIRISECIGNRRTEGTSYILRILISEHEIDHKNMKYFSHLLKLATSENTDNEKWLNILILEKHIAILKKYFDKIPPSSASEDASYAELQDYFSDIDEKDYNVIARWLEEACNNQPEGIRVIDPAIFDKKDKKYFLLWGWLGKHGISAGYDKIESTLDDEAEEIYKILYPD